MWCITPVTGESNQNNLIGFIASTVETMRDDMTTMRSEMVTKSMFDAVITTMRGDIEQVQLRLDTMEHSVASPIRTVLRRPCQNSSDIN